jgi:nitric oxide reductase activation protein
MRNLQRIACTLHEYVGKFKKIFLRMRNLQRKASTLHEHVRKFIMILLRMRNLQRKACTLHEYVGKFIIILLRMRNISDKFVEKFKSQFNNCFPNMLKFTIFVEKYDRARQARDDNTAHAHCMLDN